MDMEEHDSVGNMDSLLFELALQIQNLSRNKDELEQQLDMFKLNVAQKKTLIQDFKISIEKLEESMTQKESLVRFHKNNTKSLKVTNNLLVQYEKTLNAELERKQEASSQDTNMYQERIQNYKKLFEQHKARYCENPLVCKLIKAQREKEEVEQRVRDWEEQIVAKERELESLQGNIPNLSKGDASESDSVHQSTKEPQEQVDPQIEEGAIAPIETAITSFLIDPQQNPSLVAQEEDGGEEEEESMKMVEDQVEEALREERASFLSSVDTDYSVTWANQEAEGEINRLSDQLQELSQEQTAEAEEQEEGPEEEFGAVGGEEMEVYGDMMEPMPVYDAEENEAGDYPHTPPARMKAVQSTPTFSLNNSPGHSPGYHKSPAFMFPMNPTPETPAFSGFDCSFDQDLSFAFSNPFFGNKKCSPSKSPGFLMDQMEGRPEEDFQLFFSAKSPIQTSGGQEQGGGDDEDFPFFNFGGKV